MGEGGRREKREVVLEIMVKDGAKQAAVEGQKKLCNLKTTFYSLYMYCISIAYYQLYMYCTRDPFL